jgi:hypothetical protein
MPVPPLPVPEPGQETGSAQVAGRPAVALLLQRAAAAAERAWGEGGRMSVEEAIGCARQALTAGRPRPGGGEP